MAKIFEEKADLTISQRQEIDRIQAKDSGQRTTLEAGLLVSLAPYLTNEVLLRNEAGEIMIASGETVPDGYQDFAKGAMFIKSNAADGTKAIYENQGTTTDADFNLMGSITEAEIANGSVTSEKLASELDLDNVEITNFKLEEISVTPVNAEYAVNTLNLTGAIVPGSHAESVLTSDTTNVADDETVTIGATVYRYKDTLAQAYDVKIGASAAISLDNLKAAINATGTPGVEYFTGTLAHPTVVATTNTDTTQKIVARIPGTAANAAATTETSGHLSWADATLGGGTGASNPGVASETVSVGGKTYSFVDVLSETNAPAAAIANQVLFGADSAAALDNLKSAVNGTAGAGTVYSTGTTANTQVSAETNDDTLQVFRALTRGTAGNAIVATETLSNGEFEFALGVLAGGVAGTTADKGFMAYDGTKLYIALDTQTATTANWVAATLAAP